MKQQASEQLAARRREAAVLALKGWTQAAIAKKLQVPQGTVSRDLAATRGTWREFPVYDFDMVRLEQLQKIDLVEAEAWAAWQRSQDQKRSAAITRGKTGEQSRTSLQDQHGDPRYLREVARCVAQRYDIIGVQPPEAPPERLTLKISECAISESFRYYLVLRNMFGDPPYNQVGGLNAEQYAALVAEHERDPLLHELRRKASEPENATVPGGAEGAPAVQDGVVQDGEQVPPK